jgi:purine-nucleoside phosphorylase
MTGEGEQAAAIIRDAADLPYEVGIVLGSGIAGLADRVDAAARIPYSALPDFPASTVSSHHNELIAGWLEGVAVVVMSGRSHFYETGNPAAMREPIATLRALGCRILILTNAAGSLRTEVGPGEVMLITDHIAFSGINPLIGQRSDDRFVSMTNAYDPDLRADLLAAAEHENVALSTGVYIWFSGPSFETPAEIRMARLAGAHAVGMSTAPEVILGRFFGLRCAAISSIAHFAAGMTGVDITHEETKMLAPIGAVKLERIVRRFLREQRWRHY